jgi:hypothetical protein
VPDRVVARLNGGARVSSGLATVRTAIKTSSTRVTGIGATHDYLRGAAGHDRGRARRAHGGRRPFHCWFVGMADEQPYLTKRFPATHEHSVYQFNLHGYLAVNDAAASEKTFAILVERIIAAFRAAKPGLSTAAFTNVVDEAGPMEWVESGYRVFAGVSCHYARLAFPTREQTEP